MHIEDSKEIIDLRKVRTANGIRGDLSKKTVFSTNNNSQMTLAGIVMICGM